LEGKDIFIDLKNKNTEEKKPLPAKKMEIPDIFKGGNAGRAESQPPPAPKPA